MLAHNHNNNTKHHQTTLPHAQQIRTHNHNHNNNTNAKHHKTTRPHAQPSTHTLPTTTPPCHQSPHLQTRSQDLLPVQI